jgi:hypothetical protein
VGRSRRVDFSPPVARGGLKSTLHYGILAGRVSRQGIGPVGCRDQGSGTRNWELGIGAGSGGRSRVEGQGRGGSGKRRAAVGSVGWPRVHLAPCHSPPSRCRSWYSSPPDRGCHRSCLYGELRSRHRCRLTYRGMIGTMAPECVRKVECPLSSSSPHRKWGCWAQRFGSPALPSTNSTRAKWWKGPHRRGRGGAQRKEGSPDQHIHLCDPRRPPRLTVATTPFRKKRKAESRKRKSERGTIRRCRRLGDRGINVVL